MTLVAQHLAREAREFCDACLAAALNLASAELFEVTLGVERFPGFRVRYYWCAECRKRARVISIDRDGMLKALCSVPPAVPDPGAHR